MTRIALTLAGGVSLGAYQAGAAYELLWALAHRTDPREPVLIDVLTGASAGSMTAAVLARALLYDRAVAAELHHAWVTGVSADDLLAGEPPASLFSDRPIHDLARRILEAPALVTDPHPSAPPDLRMAFALSNLNGINYALGYSNVPDSFDTTIFSDWIVFRLGVGGAAVGASSASLRDLWRSIARAGIASGAFPFAFPTVNLERRLADYPRSAIYADEGTREFTYVDGGLFNNEPVGLARQMVEALEDADPRIERDRRLHILIDPFVAPNTAVGEFAEDPLSSRLLLGRLVDAVLGEASKRDWVRASRVNTRLRWQDDLLRRVAELVVGLPESDQAGFAARVGLLARDIAESKVAYEHPAEKSEKALKALAEKHLERNLERIGPTLCGAHEAYTEVRRDPLRTEAFLNLAYVLENVAGLRKKVDLDLYLIAPERGSLAGDFFFNFGGFFVEEWREHDWRLGRADARRLLEALSRRDPGLVYTPDSPEAYVPARSLRDVSGADIPAEAREALRRRIAEELVRFILPRPAGFFVRGLVTLLSGFAANRAVGGLLARRA